MVLGWLAYFTSLSWIQLKHKQFVAVTARAYNTSWGSVWSCYHGGLSYIVLGALRLCFVHCCLCCCAVTVAWLFPIQVWSVGDEDWPFDARHHPAGCLHSRHQGYCCCDTLVSICQPLQCSIGLLLWCIFCLSSSVICDTSVSYAVMYALWAHRPHSP